MLIVLGALAVCCVFVVLSLWLCGYIACDCCCSETCIACLCAPCIACWWLCCGWLGYSSRRHHGAPQTNTQQRSNNSSNSANWHQAHHEQHGNFQQQTHQLPQHSALKQVECNHQQQMNQISLMRIHALLVLISRTSLKSQKVRALLPFA